MEESSLFGNKGVPLGREFGLAGGEDAGREGGGKDGLHFGHEDDDLFLHLFQPGFSLLLGHGGDDTRVVGHSDAGRVEERRCSSDRPGLGFGVVFEEEEWCGRDESVETAAVAAKRVVSRSPVGDPARGLGAEQADDVKHAQSGFHVLRRLG